MPDFTFGPPPAAAPIPTAPTVQAGPVNTSNVPTNDGAVVVNPNVAAPPPPKVEGVDVLDRGDDADFEILHHLVGAFTQGARVSLADLGGEKVDVARLIKLGAVKALKEAAPATADAKKKK